MRFAKSIVLLLSIGSFTGLFASDEFRCLPTWWHDWGIGGEVLASVETTCSLCSQEQSYFAKKQPLVEATLAEFVGEELARYPNIAISCSGGGYRAMTCSLGCFQGVDDIGLLGATRHISTLSGSTWSLANWLLRVQRYGMTIAEFRDILQDRIDEHLLDPLEFDLEGIKDEVIQIISERYKFEGADLWGIILADRLFGDMGNAQKITFKEIIKLFEDGNTSIPFPLFALTFSDVFPYERLEVNPFMIGSDYLGCYVPTWAFDSPFTGGSCYKLFRERSLGWFLGMFGSGYNLSFSDLFTLFAKELNDDWLLNKFLELSEQAGLYEKRFLSSPVHNFAWKLKNVSSVDGFNPLRDAENFEISDGGLAFNIPLALVLREGRDADIILVCDATSYANALDYRELKYT